MVVNRKAVYRVLRIKQWLVHHRVGTPRAQRLRSRAPKNNHLWAMDVTHIPCGRDGWGHLHDLEAMFDLELTGTHRVALLLTHVSYHARIVINRDQVQKA